MTKFTQGFSKLFVGAAIRVVTLVLFLVVFGASAALAQTKGDVTRSRGNTVSVINTVTHTVTAAADQVPWTATGTAVITKVTKLPGGLTQIDFNATGTATHLGNTSGPGTHIQDNQGNFGTTGVFVGANGTDSVFLAISGRFETSKHKCLEVIPKRVDK